MLDACSGAADAGEGLAWRNPLNRSVNVLVAFPAGAVVSVWMRGTNQSSHAPRGHQRDWSAAPR